MRTDFVKSAEKELRRLDKRLSKRLLEKIQRLGDDPYGQNSQKLGGGKGSRSRFCTVLPLDMWEAQCRIGRTGRAGKKGIALTFIEGV